MDNPAQAINDSPIRRILIVDDEPSLRLILTRALVRAGFNCMDAADAEAAFELILSQSFDLVISDISMPGMDGIHLLKKTKDHDPHIDFIMMTGYTSDYSYIDIMDAGASDYMTKPFNINSAVARINRIAREKKNLIRLKKANKELRYAMERANLLAEESKAASRAKTVFLASMSHEIRTPLNGIIGYTDMLFDTPLNNEQKDFVKNAKLSCETLLSVVNDILDFSKVEAGKLNLEMIAFDPEVVCFETIELIRTKVDESRVELFCTVSDSVPGQVMGDPHRFRQVLLNLLGNAVKFTETGSIHLSIDAGLNPDVPDDQIQLSVCIQDTGIGIASDKLVSIFQPFNQSEEDFVNNRHGGTGLGLAISRDIAEKMNGGIQVESTLHNGSTFVFTACFKKLGPRKSRRIVRPVALKGKHVLLYYSTVETKDILNHELMMAGMTVRQMEFAQLGEFHQSAETPPIDIGIVDFGKISKIIFQNRDSFLYQIPSGFYNFPMIACASPFPGMTDLMNKTGFKGYLSKPIRKQKLFDMISFVLGMTSPVDLSSSEPPEDSGIITSHILAENIKSSTVILLVEDNPVNQKMTRILLSKAGYSIEIARDGQEAIEKYTADPMNYDLIFMDINMPRVNGYQATEIIRKFEKDHCTESRIPILALTANVMDDFKKRCLAVGMDGFLTKPIKRELVFQAIQKWTKKKF